MSVDELQEELQQNEVLRNEFRENPVKAISQFKDPIPDTRVYRNVIWFLGLPIILIIVARVILALFGNVISELAILFPAIGSAAVGDWSITGLNYS